MSVDRKKETCSLGHEHWVDAVGTCDQCGAAAPAADVKDAWASISLRCEFVGEEYGPEDICSSKCLGEWLAVGAPYAEHITIRFDRSKLQQEPAK